MSLALLSVAVLVGGSLYLFQEGDAMAYRMYKKSKPKSSFPVEFERPPKQIWGDPSDLIYQPGMPEGKDSELPVQDYFEDRGIFGKPKINYLKSNILYPFYRNTNLYL